MFRQLTTKGIVIGLVVAVSSVWTFVVFVSVLTSYRNQAILRGLETADAQLRSTQAVFEQKTNARLEALERFTFGTLTSEVTKPTLKPSSLPEAWQRNATNELKTRITAIEQWRLQLATQQQELDARLRKLESRK